MNRVPLPQPDQPIPWWMQRDQAVRAELVQHSLPALHAALDRQAGEVNGSSEGQIGLWAMFLAALGIIWGHR